MTIQSILKYVWPAYEGFCADKYIPKSGEADEALLIEEKELRGLVGSCDAESKDAIFIYIRQLHDAETKRREVIEAKSASIMQASGIITVIASATPGLSGKAWQLIGYSKACVAVLLLCALVHFYMALRCAIKARQITALYLPSAIELTDVIHEHTEPKTANTRTSVKMEVALLEVARVKRNEPILGRKSNAVSVAEIYLLRGIFFFAASLFLALVLS